MPEPDAHTAPQRPPNAPFHARENPYSKNFRNFSQVIHNPNYKRVVKVDDKPLNLLLKPCSKIDIDKLPKTLAELGIVIDEEDPPITRHSRVAPPRARVKAEAPSDPLVEIERNHIVRKVSVLRRVRISLDPDPWSDHEAWGPGDQAAYEEQERLRIEYGAQFLADQSPRPAIYGLDAVKLGSLLDISPSPPPPSRPTEEAKDKTTEDDQIYRMETTYLEETGAGNIIKGFDNYVKGSSTTGTGAGATSGAGGAASRRKGQVLEQDRVFSKSSASFSKDSPPPDSTTTTPSHTRTPSTSIAPTQNGAAAAAATNNNDTPSTTTTNQKSGPAPKKSNKKARAQSTEQEEDGDGGNRNKRQKTG
ncbi:MAG: hypothetical protein M1812_002899 [Candelaria pacifica]|nr:MAG: hypothetical protein M1812_002899 [Candelaria pacifica]